MVWVTLERESRRAFLGGLRGCGYVNMRNQVEDGWRGRVLKGVVEKCGGFGGEIETCCKGNFQGSTRMSPAKTLINKICTA